MDYRVQYREGIYNKVHSYKLLYKIHVIYRDCIVIDN